MAEQRIDYAFPERFGQLLGAHAPCQAAFEATMNWGWLQELLEAIPGVGPILGNVIATEIDGIERFGESEQLCAYAGLIPTTSSSGDKTYHGRLVSGGNKWLRWALVEAAWVAVGCDAYLGGLYRHHRARATRRRIPRS